MGLGRGIVLLEVVQWQGTLLSHQGAGGQGAGSEEALRDHRHSTRTALCFLGQTFPPLPEAAELVTAHKANCIHTSFLLSPRVPTATAGESLKKKCTTAPKPMNSGRVRNDTSSVLPII